MGFNILIVILLVAIYYGTLSNGVTMKKAHPGFKGVEKKIEKEGYSAKSAGAILANSTRNASKGAKKANPRLNRVKGK